MKICVVGDVMVDEHVYCEVLGVSPEDEIAPKLRVNRVKRTFGGAANVAENLRKMGLKVDLFGEIGKDDDGAWLKDYFPFLIESNRITTRKKRILTMKGKYICRIDYESTSEICDKSEKTILETIMKNQYDFLIVSDYAKGVITNGILDGLPSGYIVDPKRRNLSEYRNAGIITPNELEFLSSPSLPNCRIIVTLGDRGCRLDGEVISTQPKEVGDPTGCGDCFVAGLIYGLSKGLSLRDACFYGNAAGSYAFGFVGVYQLDEAELLSEYEKGLRVHAH